MRTPEPWDPVAAVRDLKPRHKIDNFCDRYGWSGETEIWDGDRRVRAEELEALLADRLGIR